MKIKWVTCAFLVLMAVAIRLPAQQSDANRKLFEQFKSKAENGDAIAQCTVAEFYYDGEGVPQDHVEAAKWFRKSAEQGMADAQYNLAVCYHLGKGVTNDDAEAVRWYRKAAEQGDVLSQYFLGQSYDLGEGIAIDKAEAVKWWRKSAEKGYADSQYSLGVCYYQGIGLTTNIVEAVKWFRRVAEQGEIKSKFNLSVINEGGIDAQYNLGLFYTRGEGVLKDYVEAYKWLNLASASGNINAKKCLSIVEQLMTPGQIAEAQELARAFRPHLEFDPSKSSEKIFEPLYTGTGFFITDDGYLISNYHVVKDAAKVRLLTGAGLLDATEVKVDAANDLALLKAVGAFKPLPIAASRTVKLGGTVATVGFPDIGLQGFTPKVLAHGHHGGNRVAGGRGG
jgi:TPR repeat protein